MPGTQDSTARRLESEKEFHNTRFSHEVRQSAHGFYKVVQAAFERYKERSEVLARDADVLEYGCSVGRRSLELASSAKTVTGIDISDVAVEKAIRSSVELGLKNASFSAMNAEEMTFADDSFDFVFGSSILHHLNLENAYREISRVMRPGGTALFLEPLGHNPLINLYRWWTPRLRTVDELPLHRRHFALAEKYFESCEIRHYGLLTLFAIPVLATPIAAPVLHVLRFFDQMILTVPGVKWLSWFTVIEFRKGR